MKTSKFWTTEVIRTASRGKTILSQLSIMVRSDMYAIFEALVKPTRRTTVLDVGVASLEYYPDSNLFERLYPYQSQLTAATIEDSKILRQRYPKIKVVKIKPGHNLPFKNKQFSCAVSWATLEHVGSYKQQEIFLNELLRVAKKIFVTTPYRACIFEPHSGIFLLHWLPMPIFRVICRFIGKPDWANEDILNPLFAADIRRMELCRPVTISVYRMFKFLPSHLIVTAT